MSAWAPMFDTGALRLKPLSQRIHDLDLSVVRELAPVDAEAIPRGILATAQSMVAARKSGASIVLMMGAHVLRSGVQRYLIDLMERGYVSCLAGNGAVAIHDYELALIGATTESVAKYISEGQFGLWAETGAINAIVSGAHVAQPQAGLGEALGQAMLDRDLPHADLSVLAQARRLGIPATIHVSIGQDIIHEHPNFDGAATGALSRNDFLKYTRVLENIEGGVVMNFGSAIMAPEVYLKALAMVRNAGHPARKLATLVCDLRDLPEQPNQEPPKNSAEYYFRPWKTMLVRTVADGGESWYVRGRHDQTIPALWTAVNRAEQETSAP